ncbi:MAG: dihydrofolate reductase [bacterium]|nr:dihydrofolate reductase [bacterium]
MVAMGKNREIGINFNNTYKLPNWILPEDISRFLKKTENHPVIIGRKTLEAILSQTKDRCPYPNRLNIVLTRNKNYKYVQGIFYVRSFNDAINEAKKRMPNKDIYILGGAEVYKYFLDIADILDITKVNGTFNEANVFFPKINWSNWILIEDKKGVEKIESVDGLGKDIIQSHVYRFMVYKRKK